MSGAYRLDVDTEALEHRNSFRAQLIVLVMSQSTVHQPLHFLKAIMERNAHHSCKMIVATSCGPQWIVCTSGRIVLGSACQHAHLFQHGGNFRSTEAVVTVLALLKDRHQSISL